MSQDTETPLVSNIRREIKAFIEERLAAKLEKLKDDEVDKREELEQYFEVENWIGDAARRASQIQQVTHAVKYAHPDANGSNFTYRCQGPVPQKLVATHSLADKLQPDVVGNAAALDVYKFLRLEVEGKTLLQRAEEECSALKSALSDDPDRAQRWMDAFARLPEDKGKPASNTLAKQLYWPLNDEGYHLLAPLFPTSLVHRIQSRIRDDRFSDASRAARDAHHAKKPSERGYCEYPDLAIRTFGGTKPQNISQLNSERYGENYLLASLPPNWRSGQLKLPLGVESIFSRHVERIPGMRRATGELTGYLLHHHWKKSVDVRREREQRVEEIIDLLVQYAAELRDHPSWSQDERCALDAAERCWLDPEGLDDEEALSLLRSGQWVETVCRRFARWLNRQLKPLTVGDAEHAVWFKGLHEVITQLGWEDEYAAR